MRALLISIAGFLIFAPAASAATFAVNNPADGPGGDCVTPGASCNLRAALLAAKVQTPGEPDTIVLGPGVHDNTGNDFTVAIDEQVTITGAGARATTVREVSGGDGRVFLVEQNGRLTISDLTVSGSRDNSGVLMFGGDNALSGTRVAFTQNSADEQGGAIDATAGKVSLADSTVSGNVAEGMGGAAGKGGGIFVGGAAGELALTNVTVTGNSAGVGSGIHVEQGSATLTHVTLAGNATGAGAGAVAGDLFTAPAPAAARLERTIAGGCSGAAPVSLGFNLEPGTGCALAAVGDLPGRDPLLGALAANGGSTDTLALAAGSPALDAAGTCASPADQRGVARPQGGACDIGAYEAAVAALPPIPARLSRLRARRVRRKILVSYRLDRAAKVRFSVERCKRIRAKRCRRWVRARRGFDKAGQAGANSFRLSARGLRAGRYRIGARPTGGKVRRAAFSVPKSVRRRG